MNKKLYMPHLGNGAAFSSLLLTFVSFVTMLISMIISKLLSVNFSLYEYGTYSQVVLVTTTVTSITSLGLGNATNYFYNKSQNTEEQQKYVSTLIIIEEVVGFICALLIALFRGQIAEYFCNLEIKNLLIIVAFMPLLSHLIGTYQNLFVSIGRAKTIAVRNLFVSTIRLISVIIASYAIHDVKVILIVLLGLDLVQFIYFSVVFQGYKFKISLKYFSPELINAILKFSVPLSIYVISGNLNNDIDKYVVGFFADTDTLAIYTNSSKRLPFDVITTSFITVLIPIMTRLLNSQKISEAKELFSSYLRLGCIVSLICGGGCIAFSDRILVLLYDEKYLPGLSIFIIYLVIEMIRFANVTIILSATGQTKIMMFNSLAVLGCNLVFNVIAYKLVGLYGPAIVTLILSIVSTCILLHFGARTLKCSSVSLFNMRDILIIGVQAVGLGIVMNIALNYLESYVKLPLIATLVILIIYGVVLLAINYKTWKAYILNINRYK